MQLAFSTQMKYSIILSLSKMLYKHLALNEKGQNVFSVTIHHMSDLFNK